MYSKFSLWWDHKVLFHKNWEKQKFFSFPSTSKHSFNRGNPTKVFTRKLVWTKYSVSNMYIVKIATISLQLRFTTFDFPSSSCPKIDCTKLQLAESCISQEKRIESGNITDFSNIWHFKLYYYKGYNHMTLFSTTQIQISPPNHT